MLNRTFRARPMFRKNDRGDALTCQLRIALAGTAGGFFGRRSASAENNSRHKIGPFLPARALSNRRNGERGTRENCRAVTLELRCGRGNGLALPNVTGAFTLTARRIQYRTARESDRKARIHRSARRWARTIGPLVKKT